MKKLAIIGSSNSFIKNGYGQILKSQYGEQCDIFALGMTGMGWVVHTLLMHKIANEYEYVVIQFGPRDAAQIELGIQSPYSIIAYLIFILNHLCNSKTIPIFICTSYTKSDTFEKHQYLIKAMARIYGVSIIDLQKAFSYIDNNMTTYDNAHYSPACVKFILEQINYYFVHSRNNYSYIDTDIKFDIFYPEPKDNFTSAEFNTSLMKGITYILDKDKNILLPEDTYLCGMLFWLKEKGTNVYYMNEYIKLVKYLYLGGYTNLYGFIDIGANIFPGLKGGIITGQPKCTHLYHEDGIILSIGSGLPVYIHSFLLSDQPILMAGYEFFKKHNSIFTEERQKTDAILMRRAGIVSMPFQARLNDLVSGKWDIFHNILQKRPDLGVYLSSTDFKAEKLLLWAWLAGRFEMDILKNSSSVLEAGIKKLLAVPYKDYTNDGYSLLHHVIWEQRDDLHAFDPDTKEGREYIVSWFSMHGAKEYNIPLQ